MALDMEVDRRGMARHGDGTVEIRYDGRQASVLYGDTARRTGIYRNDTGRRA